MPPLFSLAVTLPFTYIHKHILDALVNILSLFIADIKTRESLHNESLGDFMTSDTGKAEGAFRYGITL